MLDLVDLPEHEPVVRPGDIVDDRYEILSTIAQGGMGTVFLAEHVLIKRRLAVKILHPALASEAEMVQRFMNEAMAAGTLGHPNIVEATDMGFTSNTRWRGDARDGARVPFIVFEYLEGALLSEEVYRVGGMPPRRALAIAKQIASALDTAHAAGIVHLDLKSDNVFLTHREGVADHVKVLDFGISRFQHLDARTTRGLVMGTPEFMAPEQISSPDEVDRRADIYALGVLLYEMLSAQLPYQSSDPRILLYRICNEPPPPLERRIAPELEELLFERLLNKERSKRFQTMKEAEAAIDALLEQLRASDAAEAAAIDAALADPLDVSSGPVVISTRRSRSRRWPSLLALAVLAAAAGGAAKYGEQRMQDSAVDATHATVRAGAAQVATTIDSEAKTAQLRADSVARSTLLVSALASGLKATTSLHELVKKGTIVPPRPDEIVEVFQLRKGKLVPVLRVPAKARSVEESLAAPLRTARETRLLADIDRVRVLSTTPVSNAEGPLGLVAISTPIDLSASKDQLAREAAMATLVGLAREIDLVRPPTTIEGKPLEAALAIDPSIQSAPLTLSAIVPPRPRGRTFRTGSHVAFGAAGLLLLGFLAFRRAR